MIYRVEHNSNYTVVNNEICKDDRISWKAKGIWLYAFSKKNDWTFRLSDIVKHSTDGEKSVRAGLKELEQAGYLVRERKKDLKNQFIDSEWVFFETSIKLKESLPQAQNAHVGNAHVGNDTLISTEEVSTEEIINTSLKVSPSAKAAESAKASDPKKKIFTKEVTDLCESFLIEMRKVKPDYKFNKQQAQKWCEQMDFMIRLDNRTPERILEVLRWTLSDPFWKAKLFKPNPPKYLREKFDSLEMEMMKPPKATAQSNPNGGFKKETSQEGEWARQNTQSFYEWKRLSDGALDHCFVSNGYLNNKLNRTKDAPIKIHPDRFIELVEAVAGVKFNGHIPQSETIE